MKKYDYLIVLASEIVKKDSGFEMPEFYDGKAQGCQWRLDAAAKMFKDGRIGKMIVVGGKVHDECLKANGEKTDVMADYLIKNDIPKEKIIKIPSATNTQGNARAVKKYVEKNHLNGKIGLLTSFYHLPRAMKFFIREGLCFEPVICESILLDHHNYGLNKIHQFYINTKMLERFNAEIRGLSNLEDEKYQPKLP